MTAPSGKHGPAGWLSSLSSAYCDWIGTKPFKQHHIMEDLHCLSAIAVHLPPLMEQF